MNIVQSFLADRLAADDLQWNGEPARLQCIVLTPRFRASAHVVFLLFDPGSPDPVMVAKIPRASGSRDALMREASNLRVVQGLRPRGFSSIPRVLAFEEFSGTWILLQSALPGRVLQSGNVRRNPDRYIRALAAWTTDLHVTSAGRSEGRGMLDRVLFHPLADFERNLHPRSPLARLCLETRRLLEPLRKMDLPVVFEHGDLSAPNILLSREGSLGIVDWELGDPEGMPGADLFFVLTYLAFARWRSTRRAAHVDAFQDAFFGPRGWAGNLVGSYRRALGLPEEAMAPLFVATWARYVMTLARRTAAEPASVASLTAAEGWLTKNRFTTLWRHALDHATDLHLCESATRPPHRAGARFHHRISRGV